MLSVRWRRAGPLVPACLAILGAACGASRSATYELAAVDSPAAVFDCAERWAREGDFDVEYRHERDRRLVISRVKEDVSRSDPQFQKALDQLTVELADPGAEAGAQFRVIARTYFEYWDRRGRTRRQQAPSEEARTLARRLLEDCGSATEEEGDRDRAGP